METPPSKSGSPSGLLPLALALAAFLASFAVYSVAWGVEYPSMAEVEFTTNSAVSSNYLKICNPADYPGTPDCDPGGDISSPNSAGAASLDASTLYTFSELNALTDTRDFTESNIPCGTEFYVSQYSSGWQWTDNEVKSYACGNPTPTPYPPFQAEFGTCEYFYVSSQSFQLASSSCDFAPISDNLRVLVVSGFVALFMYGIVIAHHVLSKV